MTRLFFAASALVLVCSCKRVEFQEATIEIDRSQTVVDMSVKNSALTEDDFTGEFSAELRRNILKDQKGLKVFQEAESGLPDWSAGSTVTPDWTITLDSMYVWGYEDTEYCGGESFRLLEIDMNCHVTMTYNATGDSWSFYTSTTCDEELNCKMTKGSKKGKGGGKYEGSISNPCRGNTEMTRDLSERIKDVILTEQHQQQTL